MKTYVGTNKEGIKVCTAIIDLKSIKDAAGEWYDTYAPKEFALRQVRKSTKIVESGLEYFLVSILANSIHQTRFIGKAKCSPEDTFDETEGIELAKARARIKYYTAMEKAWCKLKNFIQVILDDAYDIESEFRLKKEGSQAYIIKRLKCMLRLESF